MDMKKYANSGFIKVDTLNGPIQEVIAAIEQGKYDKPNAIFTDGSKLSLNATNVSTLIRAFGSNDVDWINKKVELYVGKLRYNGNDNPAVLVRALETVPAAARTPAKPQPLRDAMDDDLPY